MNIHECANEITVIYVHDTRNMPSGINSGKAPCQTMMVWTTGLLTFLLCLMHLIFMIMQIRLFAKHVSE